MKIIKTAVPKEPYTIIIIARHRIIKTGHLIYQFTYLLLLSDSSALSNLLIQGKLKADIGEKRLLPPFDIGK
jgi:hypothetical protein